MVSYGLQAIKEYIMKLTKVAAIALLSIVLASTIACGTKSYQLYTSVSGQGVVSPSSGTYEDGELVVIDAIPASGWEFDYWDGDVSGNDNPVSIRIHSNKNIEAHFTEAEPTPVLGFVTYTDNTNGFSISVPDSWETGTGEHLIFIFSSPSKCEGGYPSGGVTASYEDTSVQTYYSEVVEPSIEDYDEYELISKENLTIDGVTAIKVIYTYAADGDTLQIMDCFLVRQQTLWRIIAQSVPACWNTYESTFNTMVSSFQVLDVVPSPTPSSTSKPTPTPEISKLKLADASTVLNLSSELPSTFRSSYNSTATVSELLGTGSGSEYLSRGTALGTPPWYQIQCILWIVDTNTAQQVSVEAALGGYGLTGDRVDVGNDATAIKTGELGSGVEFLILKYQNVFVMINSFYSHPQSEYIPLIPLALAMVERLEAYTN